MPTIHDAAWAADVDDEDYRPEEQPEPIRSSSLSEEDDSIEPPAKRRRTASPEISKPAATAGEIDELYNSFHQMGSRNPGVAERKKVKIRRRYQYAGEEHEEEIEVYEDSPEAIDYAEQQRLFRNPSSSIADPDKETSHAMRADAPIDRSTKQLGQGYERRQAEADAKVFKQGPKRGKGSLTSLAASLTAGKSKAVKLSTLEKSQMDWKKFVAQNDMSDELTRGRQDGWTERQAFLERTEDRMEAGRAQQQHRLK